MIFAELPLDDCLDAVLAHSQRAGTAVFRKGRVLTRDDLAAMRAAGRTSLTVAKLEPDDVAENAAAQELATAILARSEHVTADTAFTGRVNMHAAADGILTIDVTAAHALNAIDEAITLATLPPYAPVTAGQMVATIKIIPYAIGRARLDEARRQVETGHHPLLTLRPYRTHKVTLIQTELEGMKPSVLEKTETVMTERLAGMNQPPPTMVRCGHRADALAGEIKAALGQGAGMVLVVGASAISDRRDVIPAAITAAGGTVEHFGMPVDPGNLLLLARVGDTPILGLPGCVRSPKLNGCDWVMQRLLSGIAVTPGDIRALGIGGLLAEIPGRPQPREARIAKMEPAKIGAIVLAAGRSSRMGRNKLLLDLEGRPIVAHVVAQAQQSGCAEIVVVAGHQAGKVKTALAGTRVRIVEARDYASGMAASLRTGIKALSPDIDAALILLGDMPQVSERLMRDIIAAYRPLDGHAIVLPVAEGKRGNPALFDRRFFSEILALEGDVGARHIIAGHGEWVAEIPAAAREIFVDVDTPEAYRQMLNDRQAPETGKPGSEAGR